jgi:serine/threonine-protein kinase
VLDAPSKSQVAHAAATLGGRTFGTPASASISVDSLSAGMSFGTRYRIESLLGQGGMGAVYKAVDTELGRTVALKVVRPELASNPQTMSRFKQELLLASKISHKNILRIHDLGDSSGVKFITMAFVEGTDLAGLIDREGRLAFDRALRFTRQMCAAIEAAHNEGVVHRDLKPQNILIDHADNVFVTDFGLAKSLESDVTAMTRTGQLLGTPRYMAPEQVEAGDIDHRADIYALGLIMYEMFTGALPFRGESMMQMMYYRVTEQPKDPRSVCPEMPDYLAAIILKCLARNPNDRYQSAREILDDLDAQAPPTGSIMTAAPPPVLPTPKPAHKAGTETISIEIPKPSKRWLLLGGGGVLLAAIVFSLPATRRLIFRSPSVESTKPSFSLAVLPPKVADDAAQYLGDGVADALSAKLAGLREVYVAYGETVKNAMKGGADGRKIASTLGVSVLIGLNVVTSADNISITVTMDDFGKKTAQLLHQDFPGARQDLLTIEDNIFSRVVTTLKVRRTDQEVARGHLHPTEKADAYDLYLKGENLLRGKQTKENLTKALGLFQAAANADARFGLAYAGEADANMALFDVTHDPQLKQTALNDAVEAKSVAESVPEVYWSLGTAYTSLGKYQYAIAELKNGLALAPNSAEGMRRLGFAYYKAGMTADAIPELARARDLDPNFWRNHRALCVAYSKLGDNKDALESCRRMTELVPENADGWSNLGVAYYRMGQFQQSTAALQKAIDLRPTANDFSNMGVAQFFLGHYADSVQYFEKAAAMNPNNATVLTNLADAYYWSNQRDKAAAGYDRAIRTALKALDDNPNDTDAMGALATCYAKKHDDPDALKWIQKARQLQPNDTDLMYREAVVHAKAERTADAIKSLSQALQNGRNIGEAKSDPELAELRKTVQFAQLAAQYAGDSR